MSYTNGDVFDGEWEYDNRKEAPAFHLPKMGWTIDDEKDEEIVNIFKGNTFQPPAKPAKPSHFMDINDGVFGGIKPTPLQGVQPTPQVYLFDILQVEGD